MKLTSNSKTNLFYIQEEKLTLSLAFSVHNLVQEIIKEIEPIFHMSS